MTEILSLECAGSHATLRRSKTRFDSWRGHYNELTLEPDGKAIGCKPNQVGSTPTGVSRCCTSSGVRGTRLGFPTYVPCSGI